MTTYRFEEFLVALSKDGVTAYIAGPEHSTRKLGEAKRHYPRKYAEAVAAEYRENNPDWLVEVVPDPLPGATFRPAEDLTPEGIQLVIPGAERVLPPTVKQGELW